MTTKAIFRYSPKHNEVFALFPYRAHNDETVEGYGDKSGHLNNMDYYYVLRSSKPATPEQAAELKKKLEEVVGEKIEAVKRRTRLYDALSPSGYSVNPISFFSSKKEAKKAILEWVEKYRKESASRGYPYKGEYISYDRLAKCCDIVLMG
jgi:hypothetical protein